jgi:hypothetical protein
MVWRGNNPPRRSLALQGLHNQLDGARKPSSLFNIWKLGTLVKIFYFFDNASAGSGYQGTKGVFLSISARDLGIPGKTRPTCRAKDSTARIESHTRTAENKAFLVNFARTS